MDGSSKGKPGEAGIGGVARDEKGEVWGLFSESVGVKESNETEHVCGVEMDGVG